MAVVTVLAFDVRYLASVHFSSQPNLKHTAGRAYSTLPYPLAGFENVFRYFTFGFEMHLVGILAYQRPHWQVTMHFVLKFAFNAFLSQP